MSVPAGPSPDLRAATQALQRGDLSGGLRLLLQAEAAQPGDPNIKLQIAAARRMTGDLPGALKAVEAALVIEPYLLMAHLSKGFILEKMGERFNAAESYKVALKIAPPDERLPPALKPQIERAREVVQGEAQALEGFLNEHLAETRARHAGERLDRFDLCQEVFLGKKKVYYPEPVALNFPQLPPIQFYGHEHFPWLSELEAATDMIREELAEVLRQDRADFAPYIQYRPGDPVNQWAELNHSRRWSTLFLWKDGVKHEAHCARAPRTAALLERLPMQHQPGLAPTAMFSALEPRTRIPPHTGSANVRLICHLPLVLPRDCYFRVGSETRPWRMGEAWVFDDTIEHEAWNDSDEERIILIFDVWNPYLSEAERELVTAMMSARKAYAAGAVPLRSS